MTREAAQLRRPGSPGAATVDGAGQDDSAWLFGCFALLLALSLILHQLWWDGFEVRSPHFIVILTAVWTAVRPRSMVRFLAMIGAEVVAVSLDMPDVGSHTLLVLISGACVLIYVAWTSARTQRLPAPGQLFEAIAPFFAVQLLLVYAAAGVAKMNSGFLNPAISCAGSISSRLPWAHLWVFQGSWMVVAAIWGTVLIEVTLPILLAVRQLRSVGLVLGMAFHAVLALAGNVPFSALALAYYVVFLPTDTPSRLRALFATRPAWRRRAGRLLRAGGSRVALAIAVAGWLIGAALVTHTPGTRPALLSWGTSLFLVGAFAGGILLVVVVARRNELVPASRSLRLRHPVLVGGLVLVVLNNLTPYLGLKTESSMTMFSNLHTEAGHWNHLFIPEAVRVFGYQDQPVRIIASDDPALEGSTNGGTRLVPFELERYLRSHPGTTATFAMTDGRVETVRTAGSAPDASIATQIIDKIVKFQAVPPPGRGGC
ncbi:MAG: HTTM domain-containing protein [Actinomycetota bacterium]|nr:HTTM domain-containing protein [Actinomycetota bacterium]